MTKALTVMAALALLITAAPAQPLEVGAPAPDFSLPNLLDADGAAVSLSGTLGNRELAVVIWHSVTCPFVRPYDAVLPGMAAEYAEQNVAFIGINSNHTESDEQVTTHLQELGYSFPVLRDEGNAVADAYGAERTPEVFIIDGEQVIRYHGRIADNPRDRDALQSHDLRNALDALLSGMTPPVTEALARGCSIKRVGM